MIDLKQLAPVVVKNLRESGKTDEQIKSMTVAQAFDAYCDWHGLLNWGPELRAVMEQLEAGSKIAFAPIVPQAV